MLDAYVIGHGLPELAAALELAEVGLRVRVARPAGATEAAALGDQSREDADLEGSGREGSGLERSGFEGSDRDASVPDRGAPDPDGAIRAFLEHVAAPIAAPGAQTDVKSGFEAAAPVARAPQTTLLRGANGEWRPLPTPNVWGLPSVPMASDSIALLGGRGALRASVDRIRPVLTIGQTPALGALVRSRMGQQMLDRVVNPLVRERFGVDAGAVDVAIAAPGLNGALTVAGSLSGAVFAEAEAHVARETLVCPAEGWIALRAALIERLELYGVQFGVEVAEVSDLRATNSFAASGGHATTVRWRVLETTGEEFETAAIIEGHDGRSVWLTAVPQSSDTPDAGVSGNLRPVLASIVNATQISSDLVQAAAEFEGAAAHGSGAASEVTAIEALASGWTVKYERVTPETWRVTAAGPVTDTKGAEFEAAEREAAVVRDEIAALAAAPVSWQHVPWARVAERDTAADALVAEREEHLWLLRVGRGLHAGGLAAAVSDARQASVRLRRRLTGIAD